MKDNEKASQEQVDEAYTELLEIVHMLDFIGDTTSLKVLVDAVSDKTEKTILRPHGSRLRAHWMRQMKS